jgi:hypothetical protein
MRTGFHLSIRNGRGLTLRATARRCRQAENEYSISQTKAGAMSGAISIAINSSLSSNRVIILISWPAGSYRLHEGNPEGRSQNLCTCCGGFRNSAQKCLLRWLD